MKLDEETVKLLPMREIALPGKFMKELFVMEAERILESDTTENL
jgi:hypothetical protein